MNIKERLQELYVARQERMMWEEREEFLSRPLIRDVSIIDELWLKADVSNVRNRKAFVFVVLYYFSPTKLCDGKMARPVMQRLAEVTKCSKSALSHNCEDVVLQYNLYKDFRDMTHKIICTLREIIKERGMMNDELSVNL